MNLEGRKKRQKQEHTVILIFQCLNLFDVVASGLVNSFSGVHDRSHEVDIFDLVGLRQVESIALKNILCSFQRI